MPHSAVALRRHAAGGVRARRRRRAACTGCRRRSRTSRATCSRSTAGANGRNDSRNLIFRFITDCIFGDRASPMIDRPPRRAARTPSGPGTDRRLFRRRAAPRRVRRAPPARTGCREPRSSRNCWISSARETRAQIRAVHAVGVRRRCRAALARATALPGARRVSGLTRGWSEMAVPDVHRHANGPARIAGGRLDPDLVEDPRGGSGRCRRSSARRRRRGTDRAARSRWRANAAIFIIASSVMSWTDRARSISRWVSWLSGCRAGPPNRRSKPPRSSSGRVGT